MATNQDRSALDSSGASAGNSSGAASGAASAPTLDESLAQLEEALDLFVSSHDDDQYGETHVLTPSHPTTPLPAPPKIHKVEAEAPVAATAAPAPLQEESVAQAIKELKQKIAQPATELPRTWVQTELVRVPVDEEERDKRRFPRFTDSQKRMLLLVGALLLFFGLVGFLLWQRQQNDELRLAAEKQEQARLLAVPLPTASTNTEPTPVPSLPALAGDSSLADNVRQILLAYNPTVASNRYKVDVKEGVVTLSGEVQSQLEKDGVESVIKPLTGINKIVNNLVVKGFMTVPSGATSPNGPVMYPQVNPAEARRLEEALKRDLAEGAKRAEEERLRIEQQNTQLAAQRAAEETARQEAAKQEAAKQEAARLEAERLRRQQTAALQNEEDATFRRQAEERQKQREKEEAERLAEAQRKNDAAPPPAPTPRQEASALRTGTVAWRGLVKGVDDVVIRGTSASIQHVMGEMPKEPKGVFSAALPDAPMTVRLVAASGPSPIRIIQQPSASNNFTTIVRIGEGNKAEGKPHSFTLRWSAQ